MHDDGRISLRNYDHSKTLPFCPDHRDKVKGLSCRQCAVESLLKSLNIAIETLDHEMARNEITELRERLIRRRADIVGR